MVDVEDTTGKNNDLTKQVEVFLHNEDKPPIFDKGEIKTLHNNVPEDTQTKVSKDKHHKTTNVPSNCSTAILMPMNGVKRHLKNRDDTDKTFIEEEELDGNKDSTELLTKDPRLKNCEKNCDR